MSKEKSVNASEMPEDWKPGDSGVILDDDTSLTIPSDLLGDLDDDSAGDDEPVADAD